MQLTQALLERYVDGTLRLQNPRDGYLLSGRIKQISLQGDMLRVEFTLLQKGMGLPFPYTECEVEPLLEVTLSPYYVCFLDDEELFLAIDLQATDEAVVFIPKEKDTAFIQFLWPERLSEIPFRKH